MLKHNKQKKSVADNASVLLIGGTGFIGSFLGAELLQQGYNVFFLVRNARTDAEGDIQKRLSHIIPRAGIYDNQWQVIRGDITNSLCGCRKNDIAKMQRAKISRVFHCAAYSSFNPSKRTYLYKVNVEGTYNTIQLAELLEAELHYVSTAYISGDRTGTVTEDEFDVGQHFHNLYEETKFYAERAVRQWAGKGNTAIIYRPSIVVGSSKTGATFSRAGYYKIVEFLWNNFYTYKQDKKKKKFIFPVVRGAQWNIIPVDSVASAIARVSFSRQPSGTVFHIVHPQPPSAVFVSRVTLEILGYSRVYLWVMHKYLFTFLIKCAKYISYVFGTKGRRVRRLLQSYSFYMQGEPKFDVKNTVAVMGENYVPIITKDFLEKTIRYAIKHTLTHKSSE